MGERPRHEPPAPAYRGCRRDGVFQAARPGTEWLSTGWNGGRLTADAAYNISVPDGWNRSDLEPYVLERLERARFRDETDDASLPPVLLTGVDLEHLRGARCGSVTAYATAGVSNPAALPPIPPGGAVSSQPPGATSEAVTDPDSPGTVNLVVGTTCALADGALENLIAVVAEAKASTLLARTGFPGTTTDAIVVGHDPTGPTRQFSGSGTDVGAAARASTREAVTAALESRYVTTDAAVPESAETASHGVSTDVRATVFRP